MPVTPPVIGPDLTQWGRQLNLYLQRYLGRIFYKSADDSPSEDGIILFDPEGPYGVISINGAFDPIVTHSMQHGHGRFTRTTDANVSVVNTAYTVVFDTTEISAGGVSLGTPASRITVSKSGVYKLDMSAQLVTDSNKGYMYMWVAKNGTNVTDSTRRSSIESSDDVRCFTFGIELDLVEDDYVEVKYAATTTDFSFEASAATSFAPSAASVMASLTLVEFDE